MTLANDTMTNRYRMAFTFWLEASKDEQVGLADQLEQLKAKRLFAPTIRAALSLYLDLMAGRTDELYRLFPGLKIASYASSGGAQAPTLPNRAAAPSDLPELKLEVKRAKTGDVNPAMNLLRSMNALLEPHQRVKIDESAGGAKPATGPKRIAGAPLELPPPDFDFELEI
jgi:hypothetical protein